MKRLTVLLLGVFLFASGCGTQDSKVASLSIAGSEFHDVPKAFDACAGGDGGILAAWIAQGGLHGRESLRICRFDPKKRRWGEPSVLVDNGLGFDGLRLLSSGHEVHMVFGNRLRHLSSLDGGGTWRERQPLLSDSNWKAEACGLTLRGPNKLGAILLRQLRPHYGEQVSESTIVDYVEAVDGVTGRLVELGRFEPSRLGQPDPVLADGSEALEAYFAINSVRTGPPKSYARGAFVFRSVQANRDTAWTQPEAITNRIPLLSELVVAKSARQLAIFYQAGARFVVLERPEGGWTEPREVAATRSFQPTHPAMSLQLSGQGNKGWLAWIDCTRAVKPLWKRILPLLPVRDWDNNDLAISPVTLDSSSVIVGPYQLLTKKLAYVRDLRLVALGGRSFAIWVGKTKIGQSIESGGEPVRLFARALD